MIQKWTFLLALTALACGGDAPEQQAVKAEASKATVAKKKAIKFDPAMLVGEALKIALVPSPAEMQKALSNAGLEAQLAEMVQERDISVDVKNKDQIAVRTGVILADLVLTVSTATNAQQTARLGRIKSGLAALGAGDEVGKTLDALIEKIQSGSGSKADLLKELDELSGVLIPEIEYSAGAWVLPLIKAGSWLEGAHLVAGAIKKEGKYEEAGRLLRQPHVINYFIEYVGREGADKAPDAVITKLNQTLATLKEITSKSVIEEADVNTIHSATGAVLTML